ncbi:hypothetical protein K2X33_04675 [bacterium]|nr:hypothetical protein [bacterium]
MLRPVTVLLILSSAAFAADGDLQTGLQSIQGGALGAAAGQATMADGYKYVAEKYEAEAKRKRAEQKAAEDAANGTTSTKLKAQHNAEAAAAKKEAEDAETLAKINRNLQAISEQGAKASEGIAGDAAAKKDVVTDKATESGGSGEVAKTETATRKEPTRVEPELEHERGEVVSRQEIAKAEPSGSGNNGGASRGLTEKSEGGAGGDSGKAGDNAGSGKALQVELPNGKKGTVSVADVDAYNKDIEGGATQATMQKHNPTITDSNGQKWTYNGVDGEGNHSWVTEQADGTRSWMNYSEKAGSGGSFSQFNQNDGIYGQVDVAKYNKELSSFTQQESKRTLDSMKGVKATVNGKEYTYSNSEYRKAGVLAPEATVSHYLKAQDGTMLRVTDAKISHLGGEGAE